ncbi:penicillin acylase family protein [Streptomyces pseudovenezuelae]|uniref:Penicillin amidase n=1 Tax=Streptomyces pseudovenezuelae TaxID=67350 RepID=A0ABT6LFW5_9ACTN|nr:penicillin acylase family protein [Streptomyces pseudovenezuelae]MDH6215195.1 penicillin amidase [Streptomyces pseudovenezuelae]
MGTEIYRDAWGIPHLRAATALELARAQGEVTARDRAWQLETERHRLLGTSAAFLGPEAVPWDVFARRARLADTAKRCFTSLEERDPETAEWVRAYVDGVNEGLAAVAETSETSGEAPNETVSADPRSETAFAAPEFARAGLAPGRWEPWTPLGVWLATHILFAGFPAKLWREEAVRHLGEEAVGLFATDGPGTSGSNGWLVSGARTTTGHAVIAGDPHRFIEDPGVYQQIHLSCPEFDVVGLAVPGVPGIAHFGHTGTVAWAITNAMADYQDLYRERLRRTGAGIEALGPDGRWHRASRHTEVVEVAGESPIEVEVIETERGPVIAGGPEGLDGGLVGDEGSAGPQASGPAGSAGLSASVVPVPAAPQSPGGLGTTGASACPADLSAGVPVPAGAQPTGAASSGGPQAPGAASSTAPRAPGATPSAPPQAPDITPLPIPLALALRYPPRVTADLGFSALLPLLRARRVADIDRAVDLWAEPVNVVQAADTDGGTLHRVAGRVPLRAEANRVRLVNAWEPGHEWRGWHEMPRAGLADGIAVMANQRGPATPLGVEFAPPHRADRIAALLGEKDQWAPGDMPGIHMDTHLGSAGPLLDHLAALTEVTDLSPDAVALRDRLLRWDRRMDAAGVDAAAYAAVRGAVVRRLAGHEVFASLVVPPAYPDVFLPWLALLPRIAFALEHLLRAEELYGIDRAVVVREALEEVAGAYVDVPWGGTHRLAPWRALPQPSYDEPGLSGDHDCVLCTSAVPGLTDLSARGPAARYVWDLARREDSRWVVPFGASGVPGSAHHRDQLPLWLRGDLVPVVTDFDRLTKEITEEITEEIVKETEFDV